MKLGKVLTSISVFVCTSLLGVGLHTKEVEAQTARPYVVFVNGYQNCCSWGMNSLQNRLINQMNAEPRYVPYSNFDNNGSSGNTSTDEQFLRDGENFINNQLDKNRPLILIGHSFGGDSVLKLLPRINRRVQFVAVLDPVRTGGFRSTLKALNVPSNVDYFFNRWQDNEPFPNDFKVDGSISCNAKIKCDQEKQPFSTNADGTVVRVSCGTLEFCKHKNKRIGHQSLPTDDFIQKIIGDRIQVQLAQMQEASVAQQKIIGFYRDFLSREPRTDEINFRMDAFLKGYPLERQRTDLAFSDEVRQKIISFYRQYLGRDPEAGAIEFRMNALLNGRTLEQQRMDIHGR